MTSRQEFFEQLRQNYGEEKYRELIEIAGGEDKVWEYWIANSANTSITNSQSSTSAQPDKGDQIALWLSTGIVLVIGIIIYRDGYSGQGWIGIAKTIGVTLLFGLIWFETIFVIIRNLGSILGAVVAVGSAGLLLYGLFKVGVFAVDSTGSFFKWLFGHFF